MVITSISDHEGAQIDSHEEPVMSGHMYVLI